MFPESALGERVGPFEETIESDRLHLFEEALNLPKSENLKAPNPMILTVCRQGELALLKRYQIELCRLLHAEQSYAMRIPLQIPARWRYSTVIAQLQEKKLHGQVTQIVQLVTEIWHVTADAPTHLATSSARLLIRGGDARG